MHQEEQQMYEILRSDNSRSPGLEMKVSEVYMCRIVGLNPTWACERALAVFTHMYFCEVLDNQVLVFLLIRWNMLHI
jgi:hypothetical protein